MATLTPLISQEEIKNRIIQTGSTISRDYRDKRLVLLGVLKGSFIFLADLTRAITIDHEIDLIGASSYCGTSTTGTVNLTTKPGLDLSKKDVLLVEDIVDTGRTLLCILEHIKQYNPSSVKICTFIDKVERREVAIDSDYSCFTLEKGFIVGYGLDYNEHYRNIPAIYNLKL